MIFLYNFLLIEYEFLFKKYYNCVTRNQKKQINK